MCESKFKPGDIIRHISTDNIYLLGQNNDLVLVFTKEALPHVPVGFRWENRYSREFDEFYTLEYRPTERN